MPSSESILIVDDEQLVAETLRDGLQRQGHHCLIAGTGAEALRCLRSTTVALVLLDLGLPDMNGIEVMRAAIREGSDPDILIMTGQASADHDDIMAEQVHLASPGGRRTITQPPEITS